MYHSNTITTFLSISHICCITDSRSANVNNNSINNNFLDKGFPAAVD